MGELATTLISAAKSVMDGGSNSGVQGAGAAAAAGPSSLNQAPLPNAPAPVDAAPAPSNAPAPSALSNLLASGNSFDYPQAGAQGQAPTPLGVNSLSGVDALFGPQVDNTLGDIINSIGRHTTPPPPVDPLAPLPDNPVAADSSAGPQAPSISPPTETSLAPAPVNAAVPTAGAPVDPAAVPAAWTPHHENTLQQIGDFFLGDFFKKRNDDRNLTEAMQGLQKDPDGTIAKIAQFDPKSAYTMYSKRQDDLRGDRTANATIEAKADRTKNQIRAGLGVLLDPTKTKPEDLQRIYNSVRPGWQRALKNAGVTEEFDLPETFDPTSAAIMYAGGIPPSSAERLKLANKKEADTVDYRGKTLQRKDRGLGIQQGNLDERITNDKSNRGFKAAAGQRADARLNITQTKAAEKQRQAAAGRALVSLGVDPKVVKNPTEDFTHWSSDGTKAVKYQHGQWGTFVRGADGNMKLTSHLK